jgi:hypothetical protein
MTTDITGRDQFIIGLALAYAIAAIEALDAEGQRVAAADCADMMRLMARYPAKTQRALFRLADTALMGDGETPSPAATIAYMDEMTRKVAEARSGQ